MFFKKKTIDLHPILEKIAQYKGDDIELLIELMHYIRPNNKKEETTIDEKITYFIVQLKDNHHLLLGLQTYILRVLRDKRFSTILTESNMMLDTEFWGELVNRSILKILPKQPLKTSLEYVIANVFNYESDIKWIKNINLSLKEQLIHLLFPVDLNALKNTNPVIQELIYSCDILMHRLSGHAFDTNILKLVPEYAKLNNPFTGLQIDLGTYLRDLSNDVISRSTDELKYKQVVILLKQCDTFIKKAYSNIPIFGISFKAHQQLLLMERLLERLKNVLELIVISKNESSIKTTIHFGESLIEFETGKAKIRDFIYNSTQNISREITGNIGSKGESYITTYKKEYFKMLRTALGGGFLVAFACFVKMNMGSVSTSLFGKAFMYSMNYVWVFVGIYLLQFTLATKQPAMTAATLAKAIESDHSKKGNFENLALLFSRIWRTQFIAFVGNVAMVIPTALFIMFLWNFIFGTNPAEKKAYVLMNDLNLLESRLILHSAIAGLFLFISGLIAGYTTNRTKFNNFSQRIKEHPILKDILTIQTRDKMAVYIDKNIGGIVSNFWFGVFMGSTVVVGMFLGLDLDIRHITFAAGNFALALFGQNFTTSLYDILMSIIGIGLIGFINFTVSFTLSLLLALRSRGIPFKNVLIIFIGIFKYFKKYPISFYFPPSDEQIKKAL